MNWSPACRFGALQMFGKRLPKVRAIFFFCLCLWLTGCASARRDGHVFCASVFGFVGSASGGHRQFEDVLKIDLAHLPNKVVSDCDTLVWYDNWSGHTEQAIPHLQQALDCSRKMTNFNAQGYCLDLMGWQYLQRENQREKAIDCFEQAMVVHQRAGNAGGQADDSAGLGAAYDALNQYSKSLQYYQQALAIYQQYKLDRLTGHMLNAVGAEYYTLGQRDKALAYFKQALAMQPIYSGTRFFPAVKVPDLNDVAVCYDHVGQTFTSLGQHKQAIHDYIRATLYYTIFRNGTAVDWCFNRLGAEYEAEGKHTKAILCYRWALVGQHYKKRSPPTRDCDGSVWRNLGYTYETEGKRDKALQCYQQSLAILRQVKDRPMEANTLDTLMNYWKTNKPSLAIFYGKQAVNVYQEIRGNLQTMDKEIQKGYLASHESTYRKLADLLVCANRLTEAERILNMLKEDEYFEFIRRDSTQTTAQNARAEFRPEEEGWEKQYQQSGETVTALGAEFAALQAKTGRTAAEDKRLDELEGEIEKANHDFKAQLNAINQEAAAQPQIRDEVKIVNEARALKGTLRELGSGAVILYTVVCENKYHVILITPDIQTAAEYDINQADLNRKIMDFREALNNPHEDPRPLAQELYKILVAPIEPELKGARAKTLMWSLDGVLRYVPVAALYDGQHYLVERYCNVMFTLGSEARLKDTVSTNWNGLGLGVSKAHERFMALPGVQQELQGIIHDTNAPGPGAILSGTVLMDENFTAKSMFSFLRNHYPLVHIASHFQFRPGNETTSFLLLGDGSHLTLDRIKDLPDIFGGVELLTLSACDTATSGEDANGKEVEGFAVLAQQQGAEAVLASLWPVADESTQQLMREFYRLRQAEAGTLKSEALRQAQLELLNGSKLIAPGATADARGFRPETPANASTTDFQVDPQRPFAHPYYWAPFILIGNWK